MYLLSTGKRLAVTVADGSPLGDVVSSLSESSGHRTVVLSDFEVLRQRM